MDARKLLKAGLMISVVYPVCFFYRSSFSYFQSLVEFLWQTFPLVFLFSDQLASNHVLWLSESMEIIKNVLIASGCVFRLFF